MTSVIPLEEYDRSIGRRHRNNVSTVNAVEDKRSFWKSLWPILIPMKCFGSWPYSIRGNFTQPHTCNRIVTYFLASVGGIIVTLGIAYCSFLMLFQQYGNVITHIPYLLFLFEATFNLGAVLAQRKRIQSCMNAWESYVCDTSSRNILVTPKLYKTCIIVAGFLLLYTVLQDAQCFLDIYQSNMGNVSDSVYYSVKIPGLVAGLIFLTIFSIASIAPVTLLLVYALTLGREFHKLEILMSVTWDFRNNISNYRMLFQRLVCLVSETDNAFGAIIATATASRLISSMLLLYMLTLISYDSSLFVMFYFVVLFIEGAAILIASSLICSKVHEKVSVLDILRKYLINALRVNVRMFYWLPSYQNLTSVLLS